MRVRDGGIREMKRIQLRHRSSSEGEEEKLAIYGSESSNYSAPQFDQIK